MAKLFIQLLYTILLIALSTMSYAQNNDQILNKNPFSQPEVLSIKPAPAPIVKIEIEPEPLITEFILNATLISVNEPMAVVNGKLLMLDEETDGIRLISVDQGQAVIRYQHETYHIFMTDAENGQNIKKRLR